MIGNKPGNGNTDRKTAPQLATEQYSELNATFYVSGGPPMNTYGHACRPSSSLSLTVKKQKKFSISA